MHNATEMIQDLRMLPCLSGAADKDLAAVVRRRCGNGFEKRGHLRRVGPGSISLSWPGLDKTVQDLRRGKGLRSGSCGRGDYFCCAPAFAGRRLFRERRAPGRFDPRHDPGESFKEIISSGLSGIGLKVIIGMCARIRTLSNLVEDIAFKDVEQRVMLTLLRLADEKICRRQQGRPGRNPS